MLRLASSVIYVMLGVMIAAFSLGLTLDTGLGYALAAALGFILAPWLLATRIPARDLSDH